MPQPCRSVQSVSEFAVRAIEPSDLGLLEHPGRGVAEPERDEDGVRSGLQRQRRAGVPQLAESARGLPSGPRQPSASWSESEPSFPEELSDRQWDLWEPLFAIADLTGSSAHARKARIDLVMAAIMAFDRAKELVGKAIRFY